MLSENGFPHGRMVQSAGNGSDGWHQSPWINSTTNESDTTVDVPTSAPTDSPAPSPSPSEFPSFAPSGTAKPTNEPTASPTDSPAPSPAPSIMPSDVPSRSPSLGPTMEPTTTPYPTGKPSASPSQVPTLTPSASPTPAPTVSARPSQLPSSHPSQLPTVAPSNRPSASPTFVGTQKTFFQAQFPLEALLTDTQQEAFVEGTEEWIPQADVGEGSALWQPVVEIQKQQLVHVTNERPIRYLQSDSEATTEENTTSNMALEVEFEVTVVYKGSDKEFNLFTALNPLIQMPDPFWIHMLGNYNDLFLQLRPSSTIPPALVTGPDSGNLVNLSSAGTAVIAVIIVVAVGLGIAAVTVGVREYQLALRGRELHSPQGDTTDEFFQEGEEMLPLPANPYPAQHSENYPDNQNSLQGMNGPEDAPIHQYPVAPGDPVMFYEPSNENTYPHAARGPRDDSLGEIFRGNSVYGRTGSDPPTAKSAAEAAASGSYMRRRALMDDNSRQSLESSAVAGTSQPGYQEQSHEILLTKSMGGTLGAAEFPTSPSEFTASRVSSHYTNSMASMGDRNRNGGAYSEASRYHDSGSGTLGARPLAHDQQKRRSLRTNPSFDSSAVPRAGLYDVFAPSGPIGIIVDTTKDGPAVHSLKASSPMRGLINPGDLIVALDDKDTRGMTAATLTRLMAKKAHQRERKITLLANDQY